MLFLGRQEMAALTGLVRPSAQARWLRRQGYRFEVNALGVPVVAVSEVERRLTGRASVRVAKPNFSALE